MSKMIQVRHVPDEVHRALKARAAKSGETLSGYLLKELERLAGRPSMDEVLERIRGREPVELRAGAADLIREGREERERRP